tara:strand:- start:4954 stop:7536 length:2583 start_codon:yes stop_codon:yes gene_type:complete
MKIKLREIDLNNYYYNIKELKELSDDANKKYEYDIIFNIIKNKHSKLITNFVDIVNKKFGALYISKNIEENNNSDYFYNYSYILKNNNLIYSINNIDYSNIIHIPLIKYFNLQKNEFSHKINYNNISNIINILEKKKLEKNIEIILKRIERESLFDFTDYDNNIQNELKPYTKHTNDKKFFSDELFKDYIIEDDLKKFTNYNLFIEDENAMLNIIKNYLSTKHYNDFIVLYYKTQNFKISLGKNYDNVIQQFKIEKKYKDGIRNNNCEHIKLFNDGNIKELYELYIEYNNIGELHNIDEHLICKKCNYPCLCPHLLQKYLYPDLSLNKFVNLKTTNVNTSYCKICGQKLWNNIISAKKDKQDVIINFITGIDTTDEDNVERYIQKIFNNYFIRNKLLVFKKNIKKANVLELVIKFSLDHLEKQVHGINKLDNLPPLRKAKNKILLVFIYILCTLIHLCVKNNKSLSLFDFKKITNINDIIKYSVDVIKKYNSGIESVYTDNALSRLLHTVFNKIDNNMPNEIKIIEFDVNHYNLNVLKSHPIFNMIINYNELYNKSIIKIENIFNIKFDDININYNNIEIPIVSEKYYNNKFVLNFVNNKFIKSYLINNNNYNKLYNNLKHIKYNNIINNIFNNNTKTVKVNTKNSTTYYKKSMMEDTDLDNFNIFAELNDIKIIKSSSLYKNDIDTSTTLEKINNLIGKDKNIKIINQFDLINIISNELKFNLDNFNDVTRALNESNITFSEQSINRIKSIKTNNYDTSKIIIQSNLLKTLENIKKNDKLNNYYNQIINYIIDYDKMYTKSNFNYLIGGLYNSMGISSEEFNEYIDDMDSKNNIKDDDKVNFNIDYEVPYDDEDTDIKD